MQGRSFIPFLLTSCIETRPASNWRLFLLITLVYALSIPSIGLAADSPSSGNRYFSHIEARCYGTDSRQCYDEFRGKLLRFDDDCEPDDGICAPGKWVLQRIFGSTYRSTLPDFIVYFDQHETKGRFIKHSPVLMWNNKNTPYLYGVHNVYAIVFSETRVCLDSSITMDFRNEPNPFSAVFQVLGTDTGTSQEKSSVSKEGTFTWYPLSGDPRNTKMWFGLTRLTVDPNSTDRITVRYIEPKYYQQSNDENAPPIPNECKYTAPDKKQDEKKENTSVDKTTVVTKTTGGGKKADISKTTEKTDTTEVTKSSEETKSVDNETANHWNYSGQFLAANGFFSNSNTSRVAVSLALGLTLNDRETSIASGGSNQSVNGYALAKFYIIRPQIKADPESSGLRSSLGIVLGTNITHTPFDEFVFGVSWGHVLGNVGFIAGGNSIVGAEGTNEGRKTRPFIAFDYTL